MVTFYVNIVCHFIWFSEWLEDSIEKVRSDIKEIDDFNVGRYFKADTISLKSSHSFFFRMSTCLGIALVTITP